MKKFLSIICCLAIMMLSVFCFTGCNQDLIDTNLTLNYAIVEQNGVRYLHTIAKWSDSESESVCIKTTCCNNYIWFSVNNGELYANKPNVRLYYCECAM